MTRAADLAGVSLGRHPLGPVTLNVAQAGPAEGPLVVLLHGFPEFWWGWRRQIGPLAEAGLRLAILNAPHPDVFGAYARRHPTQALRSTYVALFQVPFLPERLLGARSFSARAGTFPPAELDRYARAWSEPGALTAMLNWYRALRLPRPEAPPVRVPTRVLWGRRDTALEPGLATASAALCADCAIRWFPEASHWLQHEEPAAVSRALLEWLAPP